jgi:hypothetical protein
MVLHRHDIEARAWRERAQSAWSDMALWPWPRRKRGQGGAWFHVRHYRTSQMAAVQKARKIKATDDRIVGMVVAERHRRFAKSLRYNGYYH